MGALCSRYRCSLSEAFYAVLQKQEDANVSGNELQASALRFARKLLNNNKDKRFSSSYEVLRTVSYGATCTVELVRSRKTGQTMAAKVMPKTGKAADATSKAAFRLRFLHEIAAMKIVESHRNAPCLLDAFEDEKAFYLIMEYYTGGELFEHIVKRQKKGFTEKEAAVIMKDIMEFLTYCHSIGLVHADVKPENIVFSDSDMTVKILDFGLSVFCRPHESLKNVFGTVNYCSPEMANKSCGQKTDVWSAGVLLYFMLSGHPPFAYKNKEAVLCRLKRRPMVNFNRSVWNEVSDQAKQFIKSLLTPCVDQRPTAAEALKHPWLTDLSFSERSSFVIENDTVELLKSFTRRSILQRVLAERIARLVPEEYLEKQRNQFQRLDLDNNGTLDLQELKTAIEKVQPRMEDNELRRIFSALDLDRSGDIDLTEFVAATFMSLEPGCRDHVTRQSFMQLDKAGTGSVPKDDLLKILREELDDDIRTRLKSDELDTEISSMDLDGDGLISVEEFSTAITTSDLA